MQRRPLALALTLAAGAALGQPAFKHPDRVRYDGRCFTIEGRDAFLYSGAFHYFRCPEALWPERLAKIRAAGFNAVETYVPWNLHERERPRDPGDFSKADLGELDRFLTLAEGMGLHTIVRPGPYICAEWATGGYPQWLVALKPKAPTRRTWLRSDDPTYLAWSRHWLRAVAPTIRKHELWRKPVGSHGTILVQIENEYDFFPMPEAAKTAHLRDLAKTLVDAGIETPLFSCWTKQVRGSKDPYLSQVFDNPNLYPRLDVEAIARALRDQRRDQPWAPMGVTEEQGGWFGAVGGLMSEEQEGIGAEGIQALLLRGIAEGQTFANLYMLFGGTNFGDWGAEGQTTSYDYFAPIREWGGGGAKYDAVASIGEMLRVHGAALARAEGDPGFVTGVAPGLGVWTRKALDGARFVFVFNPSREAAFSGRPFAGGPALDLAPFGFRVLRYAAAGSGAPEVWPRERPIGLRPALPATIRLTEAESVPLTPFGWRRSVAGRSLAEDGIYGSPLVVYRFAPGGSGVVAPTVAGGELVTDARIAGGSGARTVYAFGPGGGRRPVTAAYVSPGYPNFGEGIEARRGLAALRVLPEAPAYAEIGGWTLDGAPVELGDGYQAAASKPGAKVVYRAAFDLAATEPGLTLRFEGIDDHGIVLVNGVEVGRADDWAIPHVFDVSRAVRTGRNAVEVRLTNDGGQGGLKGPITVEAALSPAPPTPVEITTSLREGRYAPYALERGGELRRIERRAAAPAGRALGLVRSRVAFARPPVSGTVAFEAVIDAPGGGWLSLNGRPLGRYWAQGPQRAFYLPEPWLGERNVLEFTAADGARMRAVELRPLAK